MSFDLKKLPVRAVAVTLLLALGIALTVHTSVRAQAPQPTARLVLPDFTGLVEQVGPSVVNIRTLQKVQSPDAELGDLGDEGLRDFFRRFGLPFPGVPRPAPRPRNAPPQLEEQPRGVASGFVISADGYIMTNAHVVAGADEVIVTLTDQREFKAKTVGVDRRSDVAVVKIDAAGLPAVKTGDVSRLKVGEWVMAIGSPFGLDNTVTAGIVSAKQRDTGDYLPFIQTDVAINPGNSGGPLINMNGEVVGINSQIYSRSGGSMGISFAIPIDEAMRVSTQLRLTGQVTRGRIGVQIDQVSEDMAKSIGLGKPQGAFVRGVELGSPADKAGVQAGDVIVKFDGKAIEKFSDLPRVVGTTTPGTQSAVTVFRNGVYQELRVQVDKMQADDAQTPHADASGQPPQAATLGLVVSELTAEQKKELRLKGGVMVERATDVAARAGLRAGDVIVAIARAPINNLRDFEARLSKLDKTKPVDVLFRRGDWSQYTVINPNPNP
jgi:serine protease Do